MEKIVIQNFLVIKEVNIKVNKINIIIGSQASGKSLVAKLLYFCREFLNDTYLNSVKEGLNKGQLEQKGLKTFKEYFPQYAWKGQSFLIKYNINKNAWVSIENIKSKPVKLSYSADLIELHKSMRKEYREIQKDTLTLEEGSEDVSGDLFVSEHQAFDQVKAKYIQTGSLRDVFNASLFIPANRSIFANLQKNIFTLLNANASVDPFIKRFGSHYEQARHLSNLIENNRMGYDEVQKIFQKILVGKYIYENGEDWIKGIDGKTKTNLANASSGQQEALPMLLILSTMIFLIGSGKTYFIEEPEAHLFPVSQKHIVSLLAILYKDYDRNLVITTHSPYILTAINNLILEGDVITEKGEDAVKKAIGNTHSINFEDVGAYTIKNGRMVSIMDKESRLIGADIIDSVSDEFETAFDTLLNL